MAPLRHGTIQYMKHRNSKQQPWCLMWNKCTLFHQKYNPFIMFSDSVLRIKHLSRQAQSIWLMSPYSRAAKQRPIEKSSRIKRKQGAFLKEKVLWTLCLLAPWSWKETRKRGRGTAATTQLFVLTKGHCICLRDFSVNIHHAIADFAEVWSDEHSWWCWDHTASN